jgi:3-deoxy-D-manno-octulosonate 8-phosphate phosphatase (KDO 8-P phosphatase)
MKKIKMFVTDVDGTLTDGKIYMGGSGEMFKAFDIKDGLGIHEILPDNGVITVILTGRRSDIVNQRARELEVKEVIQNSKDKKKSMDGLLEKYGIEYSEVAYIGDDTADEEAMKLCGLKGCPSDAADRIKKVSDYVCSRSGGNGAVREFIEWLVHGDMLIGETK